MNDDTKKTARHTVVEPLSSCLPPNAGPVRIIHDATLARPLRIRDCEGVKLSPEVHEAATDLLARVDEPLGPLRIFYLRAELPGSADDAVILDAERLGALPRLFFARAATTEALQDLELEVHPRLRVVPGDKERQAIDATLDVRMVDAGADDPSKRQAVRAFGDWAARAWANAVASTLGPWLLASGVIELRLRGVMRPDRRQQLAVLSGETWPESRPLSRTVAAPGLRVPPSPDRSVRWPRTEPAGRHAGQGHAVASSDTRNHTRSLVTRRGMPRLRIEQNRASASLSRSTAAGNVPWDVPWGGDEST